MLFVDTSEMMSDIPSLLDAMGVVYELTPLKIGDYHAAGRNGLIVFERKEVSDYVGSLVSGHLADQLTRMSMEFEYSFLIIEGSISKVMEEQQITRKTYFSAYLSIMLKKAEDGKRGTIAVIPTETTWDTAMILERAMRWVDDPDGLVRSPYVGAPQILGGNPQVSALCAIDGIGVVTARALLRKFKTLWVIIRAQISEIEEVKGIGPTLAKNVYEFMRTIYIEEDDS